MGVAGTRIAEPGARSRRGAPLHDGFGALRRKMRETDAGPRDAECAREREQRDERGETRAGFRRSAGLGVAVVVVVAEHGVPRRLERRRREARLRGGARGEGREGGRKGGGRETRDREEERKGAREREGGNTRERFQCTVP